MISNGCVDDVEVVGVVVVAAVAALLLDEDSEQVCAI